MRYILRIALVIVLFLEPLAAESLSEADKNEMNNQKKEKFFQKDKQLHFLVGAVISKAMAMSSGSMFVGFSIACSIGALKELSDRNSDGVADSNDFIATSLGAGLVLFIK